MIQKKLPIKNIVIQSWDLIKENYVKLIMASILYIIFTIAISIYNFVTIDPKNPDIGILNYLIILLWFIIFVYTSVRFHRIFLLSGDEVSNSLWFEWTSRENKFLTRWLVIMLWMMLISIPIFGGVFFILSFNPDKNSSSFEIISFLFMILVYYFISRFSLVLPSVAIDHEHTSTKWSWRTSKGNSFRFFVLLSVLPLAVGIIVSFLPVQTNIFASLVGDALNIITIPFTICFLSLSYKFFIENVMENEESLQCEVSQP